MRSALGGGMLALALGLAASALATPRADWGIPTVKESPRPWLGVSITEIEGEPDAASGPGLTLARISEGGPARAAGLLAGDVLLAVDGRVIEAAANLKAALQDRKPGDEIHLTIVRGSRVMQLPLRLGTAPTSGQPERRVQSLAPVAPGPAPVSPVPARASSGGTARTAPAAVSPGGASSSAPAAPPAVVALTYRGDTTRPSLGIDTMDLEPGLARFFGTNPGEGVLIESVHAGSPASKVGVKAGDVLLRLADRAVGSGAALAQELRHRASGERVALTILREQRRLVLTAVLAPATVPEWQLAPAEPVAGRGTQAPEALSALMQHQAREVARLEVLLSAQEEGDEELVAILDQSASDAGGKPDANALRERIAALRREVKALQAQLASRTPSSAPPQR